MKRSLFVLIVVWGIVGAVQGGSLQERDFRYLKDIRRTTVDVEQLTVFLFDDEMYSEMREDFADFRIFDDRGEETPYKLDQVARRGTDSMVLFQPVAFSVEPDAKEKRTYVYVDANRRPFSRLAIETASKNFKRRVRVETKGIVWNPRLHKFDDDEWRSAAAGELFNAEIGEGRREQLTIAMPEIRTPQCRLAIEDEDNPPLTITGIKIEGAAYCALFIAEPGRSYRVCYGAKATNPPRYETSAVLASLARTPQPVEATLGQRVRNEAYSPASEQKQDLTRTAGAFGKIPLVIAAILTVVTLVFTLVYAANRIVKLPQDEEITPRT